MRMQTLYIYFDCSCLSFNVSYLMFLLVYKAAVQPSFCNVVHICESMLITSKFISDAVITSMSTLQCVEHGVFTRVWLVTASVRASRHVVDLTFRSRRLFFVTIELVWSFALSCICCFE
jgi:hypothetical protein